MNINTKVHPDVQRLLSLDMREGMAVDPRQNVFPIFNRFKRVAQPLLGSVYPFEASPYRIDTVFVGFKPVGSYLLYEDAVVELLTLLPNHRFLQERELLILHEHIEKESANGSKEYASLSWRRTPLATSRYVICEAFGLAFDEAARPGAYDFDELPNTRIDATVRFVMTPRAANHRYLGFGQRFFR